MNRPNLLLLHTDQQRFDTIAAGGNPLIHTPNLDRLMASATSFSTCIAQNPICMPSRISMMTGQYCSALGIPHMAVRVPEETETIQKMLRRAGYRTAPIGKLHYLPHANRDHRLPHPRYDFDHMELSDEPGCYEDAYRAWVRRKAPEELDRISLGLPAAAETWQAVMGVQDGIRHPTREVEQAYPFAGRSDCTHTAFVGEQTMEYLRRPHAEPFFCFSGFYSPHSPLCAPQEYFDLYRTENMPVPRFPPELEHRRADGSFSDREIQLATRGYYAMISEVDHWIGRILDTLDEQGLAENTVVVFTSDHGDWLGEHLQYGKGFWAQDAVSRVPLLISVPEGLDGFRGRHVDGIVECVDIVPTLLSLAGLPVSPRIQGTVLPVASGLQARGGDDCGLTEGLGYRSLRTPEYRYVAQAEGSEMLFDLAADPGEYHNIAEEPAYATALGECRIKLIRRMLRIEQPWKETMPIRYF